MSTVEQPLLSNAEFARSAFGFHARANYDANKDLLHTRNENFQVRPPPPDPDIWKRKPPDFRFQAFNPRPPKRNSRAAMAPWRYSSVGDQRYAQWLHDKKNIVPLPPKGALKIPGSECSVSLPELPQFHTRFHVMRPYSAKLKSVKEGTHPSEPYEMPQPHDFRQYPPLRTLGLPEFITHQEPDPFNIRFHLANPNTITGALHEVSNLREVSGTMAGPVKQPEKWEQRLHLPKTKWPHRPKEYTRYRIPWRDPDDAFMDRVEETLADKWAAEKVAKMANCSG